MEVEEAVVAPPLPPPPQEEEDLGGDGGDIEGAPLQLPVGPVPQHQHHDGKADDSDIDSLDLSGDELQEYADEGGADDNVGDGDDDFLEDDDYVAVPIADDSDDGYDDDYDDDQGDIKSDHDDMEEDVAAQGAAMGVPPINGAGDLNEEAGFNIGDPMQQGHWQHAVHQPPAPIVDSDLARAQRALAELIQVQVRFVRYIM